MNNWQIICRVGARAMGLLPLLLACFVFAQGRGVLNKVERAKVLKITSGLTNGMRESEVVGFLSQGGLEWDWYGAPNNRECMRIYIYGDSWTSAKLEWLVVITKPKKEMSYDAWRDQHLTNGF